MSWPKPEDFYGSKKPEPACEDDPVEVARYLQQFKNPPDPAPDPKVEAILEFIRSEAFGAWFEATTGDDRDDWLAGILRCQLLFRMDSPLPLIWESVLDLVRSNRWTNPETKALWIVGLAEKPPQERRRILLRLATPRWANIDAMTQIYLERARLSRETGIEHDVDHIVPIVNARVCGLHCEHNLRVVTATVNRSKSNSFDG